jgi:hypothetical protein
MSHITTSKGDMALVSLEDCDYLQHFTWHKNKKGYFVARSGELRNQLLHRIIAERAGLDTSGQIDHKNKNRGDNRRSNLRPASNGLNRANSHRNMNNKSGFKGVHLRKKHSLLPGRKRRRDCLGDRWTAQINVGGKKLFLGDFTTPEEAHAKYQEAALHYFGEFASP